VPVAGQRCSATGKVTVGLASHWPCVTDLSGLSTYGLKAREMSIPPTLLMGYGTLYLLYLLSYVHRVSRAGPYYSAPSGEYRQLTATQRCSRASEVTAVLNEWPCCALRRTEVEFYHLRVGACPHRFTSL